MMAKLLRQKARNVEPVESPEEQEFRESLDRLDAVVGVVFMAAQIDGGFGVVAVGHKGFNGAAEMPLMSFSYAEKIADVLNGAQWGTNPMGRPIVVFPDGRRFRSHKAAPAGAIELFGLAGAYAAGLSDRSA